MTVTSEVRIDDYVGDGIVTVFPYTFVILDASDLKVFFNLAEQVGGFTVDGVGNPGGGNVTFDVAPADQINIRLSRFVPLTQEIDLTAFDPFPAETVEDGLDNLTFQTQQLQGQIDILAGTVGVISVFGRVGVVTAQLNDYAGSLVGNVPAGAVTATNVQGAINELESLIAGIAAPVDSVFGRVGAVVAQANDYTAIEVANIPAGNITSDNVQDALDELDGLIVAAPVDSVFGRTGAVVADPGDYTNLDVLTVGTFTSTGIDDNADAVALTIDPSERLLVGHSASVPVSGLDGQVQISGTGAGPNFLTSAAYSADTNAGLVLIGAKSRSTTVGTPGTAAADGDLMMIIRGVGDDGTDLGTPSTDIRFLVDGAVSSNVVPGRIELITADAAGASQEAMRLDSSQDATFAGDVVLNGANSVVFINETVNTNMNTGVTINQGTAIDQILSLKSNNVATGLTTLPGGVETDDFCRVKQSVGGAGGLVLTALGEDTPGVVAALVLEAWGGRAQTSDTVGTTGLVTLNIAEHDGANAVRGIVGNGSVFTLRVNNGTALQTRLLVKGDGALHVTNVTDVADAGPQNVMDGTALDHHDDVGLLRMFEREIHNDVGILMTKWDESVTANMADLKRVGVMSSEGDFYNVQRMNSLLGGAIWQTHKRVMDTSEALAELTQLLDEEAPGLLAKYHTRLEALI